METIAALELVVGFPVFGAVSAAQRGTLQIVSDRVAYGLALETGQRTTPMAPDPHEPLHLSRTAPRGRVWVIDGVERPLVKPFGRLLMGTDDRIVSCTADAISVFDRTSSRIRSVTVPPPLELSDKVTGGLQSKLEETQLYVDPGFVVFVRTPALLVVALADLERALVFDEARWSIQTILAIRQPELSLPATLGKWTQRVVSDRGQLDVTPKGTPARVRDLMWPPNGWAAIDLTDGTTVPAFTPPPEHRMHLADISEGALFKDQTDAVTWRLVACPAAPAPPSGHADLVVVPAPSHAGAIAYATKIRLHTRQGARGTMADALARITTWPDNLAMSRYWLGTTHRPYGTNPGVAYIVPALIAIASDPRMPERESLAWELTSIARTAHEEGDRVVAHAFRLCLPLLLELREATHQHAVWWATLVAYVAATEQFPAWWQLAKQTNRQLAALDEPGRLHQAFVVALRNE